ncbi:SURF1 family protein [Skermania piniformis]
MLAILVGVFAYLCFSVLAPWQLHKNSRTEHRNDLIARSVDADPASVGDLLGTGSFAEDDEWRRVNARGSYVPGSTVLVRLRSVNGDPAFEVLNAFRLDDGRILLVDRGYARAVESSRPPPITDPPTGPRTLQARIRQSEGVMNDKPPAELDGYRQVYSIDSGQVGGLLGLALVDGYLQLEPDQPGSYEPIPLPQLDAGPYLSYGLQWLAFGIMAPLGLAYFIRAEILERRKSRIPSAPGAADGSAPPTTEAKLADRYGKSR